MGGASSPENGGTAADGSGEDEVDAAGVLRAPGGYSEAPLVTAKAIVAMVSSGASRCGLCVRPESRFSSGDFGRLAPLVLLQGKVVRWVREVQKVSGEKIW